MRNQLVASLVRVASRVAVHRLARKRKGSESLPYADVTVPYTHSPVGPDVATCERFVRMLEAWEQGKPEFMTLVSEHTAALGTQSSA